MGNAVDTQSITNGALWLFCCLIKIDCCDDVKMLLHK